MKVVFLSVEPVAGWGGSEELWAEAARFAIDQGHKVWITPRVDLHGPGDTLTELERMGAVMVLRRPWTDDAGTIRAEVVPAELTGISQAADVVLLSAGGSIRDLLDDAVVRLIESTSARIVATIQLTREHDLLPDDTRDRARKMLGRLSGLVVPADRSIKVIERAVAARLPPCAVIPSPIRRDLEGPAPWPKLNKPTLACVARLNPVQKGHDLLLEVLSDPAWTSRDWHLNFVGRGLADTYLRELATYYGLAERVTLAGFQQNIGRVWDQNHLLIMPSREESMPISIMEAMFSARPCLVTDVGDNAKLITEGVNGFVAEGDRPRALAHALERAWAGRGDWQTMGLRAHEVFSAHRDPSPGRTLLSLLIAAVSGQGGATS